MRLEAPQISLPAWLGGAIFDKELRAASRRRRHYVLRSVYMGVLILFFLVAWWGLVTVGGPGAPARTSSEMSRMAAGLTVSICWLQFLAGQTVVIFMLAGAINQEVRQRTLGVLMSTPLGGLAIATGKLAGRLLQVLCLVGLSLPVLAISGIVAGYFVVGVLGYLFAQGDIRRRIFRD